MIKSNDIGIEKLKGSAHYHSWKLNTKNYLEIQDLEKRMLETGTGAVAPELKKAKNILSLSVKLH